MTQFRLEREFRGTRAQYWRAFFDDDCSREQYDLVGVRSFEVVHRHDDGDTLVRAVRVIPKRDFPAFMRKVFGTSLGFTETTTLHREDGYAETRVVPDMLAKRVNIAGKHSVIEADSGGLARVFEGHIEVALPLVGGRIEQLVYKDLAKSYEQSSAVTQAWLDRWAADQS